jgi:hypothetical protein
VRRFRVLTQLTRDWVERNGYLSQERTEQASEQINELYTEEENQVRRRFNAQMPAKDIYLKAMGKGLVEVYGMHSTAAQRILFVDYIFKGAIDVHEEAFDDLSFWVEAAKRSLEPRSPEHILLRTVDELNERRQDLLELAAGFNQLGGPETIESLESLRTELENHKRAKVISEAIHALREVENALPDWSNTEFRTAGMKLENAVKAAREAEKVAQIDLAGFVAWLETLHREAARLHTAKRDLLDTVETRPDGPTSELGSLHQTLVDTTIEQVGEPYVTTAALWNDTYISFAEVMADETKRRSAKLTAFNDLFRAMFIDRHPAYPVYRHWFDLTERAPEFPAPPTSDPTPRVADEDEALVIGDDGSVAIVDQNNTYVDEGDEVLTPPKPRRGRRIPWVVGILVLVAAMAAGGVALNQAFGGTPTIAVTISPTPTANETGTAVAQARADNTATADAIAALITPSPTSSETPSPIPSDTATAQALATLNIQNQGTATALVEIQTVSPTPSETVEPTATFVPSDTPIPTDTLTPSDTPTPTETPTPDDTATPTVPPGGVVGETDMLSLIRRLPDENPDAVFWEPERFSLDVETWRFGIGAETAETTTVLAPSPELLLRYLGDDAPSRLTAVEATLALTTFNPALLEDDGVYMGLVLAPADSADPLSGGNGIHVDVVQPGVVNIGGRTGDDIDIISQRALNAVVVRLRLERTEDGRVQTYFNGEPLAVIGGNSAINAPLVPAIYITDGGVIVNVTEWRLVLR